MNAWLSEVSVGLARNNLILAAAALAVGVASRGLGAARPALLRGLWVLVLLQGWWLPHWVLTFPWRSPAWPEPSASGASSPQVNPHDARAATDNDAAALVVEPPGDFPPGMSKPAKLRSNAWMFLALAGWSIGIVAIVVRSGVGYVRFAGRLRSITSLDAAWAAEWRKLLADHGVARTIHFRVTDGVGPLLIRLPRYACVLVPRRFWQGLDADQRRAILRHELAHLQRGDLWKSLAVRLLWLPHWFNPLAWWAVRRFDTLGEWACDDAVARAEPAGLPAYSRALLQLAATAPQPLLFGSAAAGSTLSLRIRRLLLPRTKETVMSRISMIAIALALVCAGFVRVELSAQEPAQPQAYVAQAPLGEPDQSGGERAFSVDRAIERGAAFLMGQRREDGTWQYAQSQTPGLNDGVTALCALAILSADAKADPASLAKALDRLRDSKEDYTYAVALRTMVFAHRGPARDLEAVRRNVRRLEQSQVKQGADQGSWSYTSGPGRGDGSNSRFAALALDAAEEAGIPVDPETWKNVRAYWTNSQKADGSWGYTPQAGGTPSMTCAGIASLIAAERRLRGKDAPGPKEPSQPVQAALKWLAEHYAGSNQATTNHFYLYYLHALKTAGTLAGQQQLAGHDWRTECEQWLLEKQDANTGAWTNSGAEADAIVTTSFALLFLAIE